MIRRRDGEYRIHEYDPETVSRLAVELLQAFAKDPQAAQIADLDTYIPDITWLATGDQERDDLVDAIYEACGTARIVIPSATGNPPDRLVHIVNALAGECQRLAAVVAPHLGEDARKELTEHVTKVLGELPDAVNEALSAGEDAGRTAP